MAILLVKLLPSDDKCWEQILLLAQELSRQNELGEPVLLVSPDSQLERIANEKGIRCVSLPGTGLFYSRLRQILKKIQPLIVHTFDLDSFQACLRLRSSANFRLVHSVNQTVSDPGRGKMLNKADAVIFGSPDLSGGFKNYSGHKTDQVIFPALTTAYLRGVPTANKYVEGGRFIFVNAGDMVPDSDHDSLIQAMAHLQNMAIKLPPWEVRIVGQGPLFAQLLESADKIGVAGSLALLGEQDRGEVLPRAHAVVASSAAGNDIHLLLEAWSLGLPVACTSLPGNTAADYGNGAALFSEPGNHVALAGSILRLMTEPETRQELIEKGFGALHRFTPQQIAADHMAAYQAVLRPSALGGNFSFSPGG